MSALDIRKLILLVACGLLPVMSHAGNGTTYLRVNCNKPRNHTKAWDDIVKKDFAIKEGILQIYERSQKEVLYVDKKKVGKFTNCVVEYPVKDGKAVTGRRVWTVDMQWYTDNLSGGKLFHHNGIRFEYHLSLLGTSPKRTVTSIEICMTPNKCRSMGIPFRRYQGKEMPDAKPSPEL